MRGVVILVSVVLLGACERPVADVAAPEATYRRFAEALRGRDPKTAWALLSPATQSAAEARSKAVSAASQGLVADQPMIMVLQSGVLPNPNIGDVTVLKHDERTALLEVGAPGHRQQVSLVRETASGPWAIDLSAAFSGDATK